MVKASSTDDLYEQLEALPEHLVGEIIDGELVVSPRPALRHALASSSIHYDVYGRFHRGSPGGWWIVFEPELHLGSDVVDPNIAGWRRERLPILPDAAFSTVPPDWVCEILSPSTAFSDRKRKMPIYAREGVPHFWLVAPHLHSLESSWTSTLASLGQVLVRARSGPPAPAREQPPGLRSRPPVTDEPPQLNRDPL